MPKVSPTSGGSGYPTFFEAVTGTPPYPYQEDLGTAPWPELLDIPTGLGKTAAIVVAWLWKRIQGNPDTPRRLVYCLPMRVLVEQTERNARAWTEAAAERFRAASLDVPSVSVLMGGDVDLDWIEPERPAILVGTQDMLVSRALNRGYGMSPFQWPIHFALLQNDAFWVFDEVQLMGPAVATSAQLEAFRRSLGTAAASRSLWASATLATEWLATVDLEEHTGAFRTSALTPRDHALDRVTRLTGARKRLENSVAGLDKESAKKGAEAYLRTLNREVLDHHRPATNTLVILNRVDRAQGLYHRLQAEVGNAGPGLLLIHSRFRPAERKLLEARLGEEPGPAGRVIVSTQVVEAGVDLTSATLFTELCPWPSFVQRCGRCNRRGEHEDARVLWIDLDDIEGDLALPYNGPALAAARLHLERLEDVGPARLPRVEAEPLGGLVLRRRDLLELFNSDPDLFGFHVDVSPYIRDGDDRSLQVFWRELPKEGEPPPDLPRPVREELCSVSISVARQALAKRHPWEWDAQMGRWRRAERNTLRPGMTLLLDSAAGAYDLDLGFTADARSPVPDIGRKDLAAPEAQGDDRSSWTKVWVALTEHLDHVAQQAEKLARGLDLPADQANALTTAARWHDAGKAHPVFQKDLFRQLAADDPRREGLWAKSGRPDDGPPAQDDRTPTEKNRRRYFRHELASALGWLAHRWDRPEADLVAYLIAAHHGKVRMGLRSLPAEPPPEDGRRHARGVWEGDVLPAVTLPGEELPATGLDLEVMELGEGTHGPSWSARTQELLRSLGPFRLAWLEALLRIADWRASAAEARKERP
jgi:CRISPR-associated endonuclease/helicase Cas3